jgi:FG-GAP repeat protein
MSPVAFPARRRMGVIALAAALTFVSVASAAPADSEPWIQRAKLVASDGASNDFLGRSVAFEGDVAVVGAAGSDPGGAASQGAAYVYVRSNGAWSEVPKLTASDGAAGDEFGFAVAISGDTIVVGARFASVDGISGRGAGYVFVRSGDAWVEQTKLAAADGAAFDELGDSVAIDGDTVLLGAPFRDSSHGAVYAFVRDGDAWSAQGSMIANDGAEFDRFGLALAIEGDQAFIGSPSADVSASTDQGAVYAFARNAGVWTFATKLTAADGAAFDEFGNAVAIDADTLAVGAHAANIGSVGNQGAAYAFVRDGEAWTQQAKFVDETDGFFGDEFGISIAIAGDDIAIGALFADPNADENEGRAYVFHRDGEAWSRRVTLTADDGVSGEEFGIGIAIDAGTVVVGAEFGPVDGDWRGAAYVFSPEITDRIFGDGFE